MAEFYLDQASVVGGATDRVSAAPQKTPALAPPDKPSVAVVPFTNMRADPEKEFFAAVITSSAMPSLFRYPSLFVLARNSSFTYKSRSADVKPWDGSACACRERVACVTA
jgi:adenylate cyclase